VVERNVGRPGHSALQKILIVHLAAFEKQLQIAVRPECRTRIQETCYRVPDVLVMVRPFRQSYRIGSAARDHRDPVARRQGAGHSAPVSRV